MNYLFAICGLCLLIIGGCTSTAVNTCDAIDAAHEVFLAEVAADPASYTEKEKRNERLTYAAAKIACTSYVRTKEAAS